MLQTIRFGVASLLLGSTGTLYAQNAPKLDLAVTYVSERSLKANTGENFWSQGGSVELGVNACAVSAWRWM